jgi:hypothetical protein
MRVLSLSAHFPLRAAAQVDRLIIFFLHNLLVRLVMFFLQAERLQHYHGHNLLAHRDRKVLKVHKVLKELQVLKVQPVFKALHLQLLGRKVFKDHRDHKDHKALQVPKVQRQQYQAQQYKDQLVLKALKDHKV